MERLNRNIAWTRHAQLAAALPESPVGSVDTKDHHYHPTSTSRPSPSPNPHLPPHPPRLLRPKPHHSYRLATLHDTLFSILHQTYTVEGDIKALLAMPPPPKRPGESQLYDFGHMATWRGEVVRWDSLGEAFRERVLAWSDFSGDIGILTSELELKGKPQSEAQSDPQLNSASGWLSRFSTTTMSTLKAFSSSSPADREHLPSWNVWNDRNQGNWSRVLYMITVVQAQMETVGGGDEAARGLRQEWERRGRGRREDEGGM
ncbi:hypothetical protein BKA65DRAFT_485085 [Rhexocercosporidium sp. MPI-PUGE-AT-0058]|nr:hypothetical protein BKA65DRAFT_485085 [Rhexocercosporidium sp. MPI-PUGE-AT-0058]